MYPLLVLHKHQQLLLMLHWMGSVVEYEAVAAPVNLHNQQQISQGRREAAAS
jgi:hypothetical protein